VDLVTTSTTDLQPRWGIEIACFTVVEMVQDILDMFKYWMFVNIYESNMCCKKNEGVE
jgi:hypothetical protein